MEKVNFPHDQTNRIQKLYYDFDDLPKTYKGHFKCKTG